jgi:hypothetical protein
MGRAPIIVQGWIKAKPSQDRFSCLEIRQNGSLERSEACLEHRKDLGGGGQD